MTKIQSQSTSNPTSISQWAAVEALNTQDFIAANNAMFKRHRDMVVKMLNAAKGIDCITPKAHLSIASRLRGKTAPMALK